MRLLVFAGMIALACAPAIAVAKVYMLLYHRGSANTMKRFGAVAPVWLRAVLFAISLVTFLGLWFGLIALSDRLAS